MVCGCDWRDADNVGGVMSVQMCILHLGGTHLLLPKKEAMEAFVALASARLVTETYDKGATGWKYVEYTSYNRMSIEHMPVTELAKLALEG